MKKEILESRLIAEFMGYEVIPYQGMEYKPIYNTNKYAKTIGELKKLWEGLELEFTGRFTECINYPFDSDWNYLMPIINRILNSDAYGEDKQKILNSICPDIKKTYLVVIEYLRKNYENKPRRKN